MTKTLDDFSKEFTNVIGKYEMKHGGIISVGIATGLFRKLATEYASQQRTEGIREGFDAARERMVNDTIEGTFYTPVYDTVEAYLNSKE